MNWVCIDLNSILNLQVKLFQKNNNMKTNLKEKIIFILMFVGSVVAIFLPNYKKHPKVMKAKVLLEQLNRQERYITADDLAKALMIKDPTIMLIDVRSKEEYNGFTLDGAINIPMEELLKEDYLGYLDQDVYKTILFSNGTSLADEAWMIMKSHDYEGNYVLKGGLNTWFKTIIDPEKPLETADIADREAYEFRRGASMFFTGVSAGGVGSTGGAPKKAKTVMKPVVKRKKKAVSGGCG